jgi:long-chain acyl-CoA synthetase
MSPDRLDQRILAACEAFKGLPAIADGDRILLFGDLADQVSRVAAMLTGSGLRPGDPVVIAVENRWSDIVAEIAVWNAGGVVVPVHRSTPAAVMRETTERTGAHLLVSEPHSMPSDWSESLTPERDWVFHVQAPVLPPREINPEQALVAFTSGSTGRSKGVVLSHAALGSKLDAIAQVIPFQRSSVTLQVLQLNFTFGQWTTLLTLLSGGTVWLMHRFSPQEVITRLAGRPVDQMAVVPTMLRLILANLDDQPVAPRAAALRECPSPGLWIAGGEPLAAGLGRRILGAFPGTQLADVFGLSETSTSDLILGPHAYQTAAGTVGWPSPGVRVRIVGEDGIDRPVGDVGELWICTPYLMTGYLGDRQATAAAMSGSWFRTGDLGRLTAEGAVELVGRSKFLIVRGGHKVSPLSIEGVVTDHPQCRGACALGVPDRFLGERIVVLFEPTHAAELTQDDVRSWVRARVSPLEVPDQIVFVDDIPVGRTGKMDRLAAHSAFQRVCDAAPA